MASHPRRTNSTATAFVVTLIGFALIGLNAWFLFTLQSAVPPATAGTSGGMEYKDFVAILLTAVTVVLAVLAIGVAVLAIWGYKELLRMAELQAEGVAKTFLDSYVTSPLFKAEAEQVWERLIQDHIAKSLTSKTTEAENKERGSFDSIPDEPKD
jgi:ABC-type Co2+ transport system permease subunit